MICCLPPELPILAARPAIYRQNQWLFMISDKQKKFQRAGDTLVTFEGGAVPAGADDRETSFPDLHPEEGEASISILQSL